MAALKCCILIFMEMKLKGNVTNQIIHAETRQVMQPVQNNMEHVKYIPGVEEERDSGRMRETSPVLLLMLWTASHQMLLS